MSGIGMKMVDPESVMGRVMQSAFRTTTDDVGWIDDDAEAYVVYAAGFINALQLLAGGHPDMPEVLREAIAMLDDNPGILRERGR